MGHHLKNGDFLSDKYRILRIDSLEKMEKEAIERMSSGNDTSLKIAVGISKTLEDIKKSSEDVSLNKIVLSFKDVAARIALRRFCAFTDDGELVDDIREVLNKYKEQNENK